MFKFRYLLLLLAFNSLLNAEEVKLMCEKISISSSDVLQSIYPSYYDDEYLTVTIDTEASVFRFNDDIFNYFAEIKPLEFTLVTRFLPENMQDIGELYGYFSTSTIDRRTGEMSLNHFTNQQHKMDGANDSDAEFMLSMNLEYQCSSFKRKF